MANANERAVNDDPKQRAQWAADPSVIQEPFGLQSGPPNSEDIDAQIRGFFDNAREHEPSQR
jgi:hypothetical protein